MLIMDIERGFHMNENNRNISNLKLTKKDLIKLRKNYVVSKKEILKLGMIGQNCSICFDSLENVKKRIVKLPKCMHLFHWKYG